MQFAKTQSTPVGTNAGAIESSSRDRLIYVSTCLIGLNVEVHVKNGSIYSGIFHSTNTEKDFGIVLKMARITIDGSQKEPKPSLSVKRPHTVIIPSRELVQIIAKDVPLTGEEFSNGHIREKQQDLMTDSAISRSKFIGERALERWTPDDDDLQCPGLDDILDGSHDRRWDQFETNELLFGVKSTFNEEFYTTKLERGPQTRELEKEALRIAREMEGLDAHDLHLTEDLGIDLDEESDLDEETRFSAVKRQADSGPLHHYENIQSGFFSEDSSGQINSLATEESSDISERKSCNAQLGQTSCSLTDDIFPQSTAGAPVYSSNNFNEGTSMDGFSSVHESRILESGIETANGGSHSDGKMNTVSNEILASSEGIQSLPMSKSHCAGESLALDACAVENKASFEPSTFSVGLPVPAQLVNSNSRPGSSKSSTSDQVSGCSASSGPGLSPSSSMNSEKSKLNPYAKEFKLNPNAKSFTPSTNLRPQSPVSEGSFYFTTSVSAVPHAPGLPVGVGISPPYGMNQPVVYNPQAIQMQAPPAYMHPSAPYGQQIYFAQPRPVLYMPSYPPEMPYKGRDF